MSKNEPVISPEEAAQAVEREEARLRALRVLVEQQAGRYAWLERHRIDIQVRLRDRERLLLIARLRGATYDTLADTAQITRERVRQIVAKALNTLADIIERDPLP